MTFGSDATLEDIDYDLALLKCPEVLSPARARPNFTSLRNTFFQLHAFGLPSSPQACRKDIVALVASTRDGFVAKIKFTLSLPCPYKHQNKNADLNQPQPRPRIIP
jgi:hypothetical protein